MSAYYLLGLGTFVIFSAIFYVLNRVFATKNCALVWLFRGLSLCLGVFFLLRYFSNPVVLKNTTGLNINSPFGVSGTALTAFSTVMIWFTFSAQLLLFTYGFYKNKIKTLTPLVKYFASAIYLLNIATINVQVQAMGGVKALESLTLQGLFFSFEVGVALSLCFATWFKNPQVKFDKKTLINSVFLFLFYL